MSWMEKKLIRKAKKKRSWKMKYSCSFVGAAVPGVNRRNFVTRWNFICKLLATMFGKKFRGQKKFENFFFVEILMKHWKIKYLIKFFVTWIKFWVGLKLCFFFYFYSMLKQFWYKVLARKMVHWLNFLSISLSCFFFRSLFYSKCL